MSENKEIKELIESFSGYRALITPLQDSLHKLAQTYDEIRADLDTLTKNFSGSSAAQLDKINATLSAQAQSGKELGKKISEYASSADKYASSVQELTAVVGKVADRLETVSKIEETANELLGKLDALINEKRASYNLKDLQKSLDVYGKNVERINEFINKDIADVLKQNAEKTEEIAKRNDELVSVVTDQSKTIADLTAAFVSTSDLIKKTLEAGTVNEEYLFDAFDKWADDRKVRIRKK